MYEFLPSAFCLTAFEYSEEFTIAPTLINDMLKLLVLFLREQEWFIRYKTREDSREF